MSSLLPARKLCDRPSSVTEDAFWHHWLEHRQMLYRCCVTWMGGDRYAAEDALSLAALKGRDKWLQQTAEIENPRAWLKRLVHNLCVDLHRHRGREAKLDKLEAIADSRAAESPETLLLRRELDKYIRGAISSLPLSLREPFILRCHRQLPYSEIARQLNLSNANARKRIQKARSHLRAELSLYLSSS